MFLWFLYLCTIVVSIAQEMHFSNSIGMEFVLIQPGNFRVGEFKPPYPIADDTLTSSALKPNRIMWMGNDMARPYNAAEFENAKQMAIADGSDGFEVKIENAFYIGKFEVTQDQWKKLMGSNPSTFSHDTLANAGSHPVENVSWQDVQRFLKALNQMEKTKRYRLPYEFEWEYAARGGKTNDITWAEINESAQLGGKTTRPVGQKMANAYGLYDMLGNVWEWVNDFYNEKIFADPIPPKTGKCHVLKGASFTGDVKNATYMTHAAGPGNGWDVGFRVVAEIIEDR
ncbi:MAG TPA: SUMF1/EgtB/PvdO family nonheme iron enzyme [Chryseosolibacter sp.]|nr:SUMF1/EgtB/PvdO family nonheme iron enzyme [Chryseosolibacter sp.]